MMAIHHRSALKYSNQLSQRLSRRVATGHSAKPSSAGRTQPKSVSEMHIGHNEDHINVISRQQMQALPPLPDVSTLSRLKRAVIGQNIGFDENDIRSPDRSQPLPDYAFEPDRLNPETKKRQAQDKLLLLQLDAGVLPESYILPSADPNMLKIDLSNYGIGDKRGLCLGNW